MDKLTLETKQQLEAIFASCSVEQLKEVHHWTTVTIKLRGLDKMCTFKVGDTVRVDGRRSGGWTGTVDKINRTKVVVHNPETNQKWNCPANILEIVY